MSTQLLDIPRLYTGIAEWMACMVLVLTYRPRLKDWRFYVTAALLGGCQCAFMVVTDNVPLFLWIPCMVAAWVGMVLQLRLLSGLSWITAAYAGIRAFILAEFAASMEWQLHCFFWPEPQSLSLLPVVLLLATYGTVFGIAWGMERRGRGEHWADLPTGKELLTVGLIAITVFAVSNLSFYYEDTPFSGRYAGEIMNIRTLVDFGGTAILFAYHLQRQESLARKELDAMHAIWENQYAQYRMSRDSIELVNRKYHDLKHQIAALRAETDPQIRTQWLDEMEEDIRSYEAQNKTGHHVLDTLLTGKSLYCQKHGITFSVVADGKLLEFMDIRDICTLFGNAMDNAIECELKIQTDDPHDAGQPEAVSHAEGGELLPTGAVLPRWPPSDHQARHRQPRFRHEKHPLHRPEIRRHHDRRGRRRLVCIEDTDPNKRKINRSQSSALLWDFGMIYKL